MKYENYRYIYPPRPKNAIPISELNHWDNDTLLAQPKLNGSNCLIFTNGITYIIMNRHKQKLTNFRLTPDEIKNLYRGDGEWMVLNGEYLNKNKKDESGKPFNHKFIIFDILTYKGEYLVGKTFLERIKLLDELYGEKECEKSYLYNITENVYRVKSYYKNFNNIFNDITKDNDVIEGLLMKRINAKLEIGLTESNNIKSQIKCRVPTKNYKY